MAFYLLIGSDGDVGARWYSTQEASQNNDSKLHFSRCGHDNLNIPGRLFSMESEKRSKGVNLQKLDLY